MKEEFLYYVWKYHLWDTFLLKTIDDESVEVIQNGMRNDSSGPDFLEAQIKIDNMLWAGNVEIHVKSSDWNLHKHQFDKAYNNVILHVVFEHDLDIENERGEKIPTIVLKECIHQSIYSNYQVFIDSKTKFIPCENQLVNWDNAFILEHFKTRLLMERLEDKTEAIEKHLETNRNDWEHVLFVLLAKYFGMKANREAMEIFALSFEYSVLKKCQQKKIKLEALFFGQAGFLEAEINDTYFNELKKEYTFLKAKYNLTPCDVSMFKFFGVRPPNYPTIRLGQLAAVYYEYQNLFSFLMKVNDVNKMYPFFEVEVSSYWEEYYHFKKKSSKLTSRNPSKMFIDVLLVNVVVPLKYHHQKTKGKDAVDFVEVFLTKINSEKNSIISGFENLNVSSKTAWDSQALIQLKIAYCNQKKCLNCTIGNQLLRVEK